MLTASNLLKGESTLISSILALNQKWKLNIPLSENQDGNKYTNQAKAE
jgi:hypothetical protein